MLPGVPIIQLETDRLGVETSDDNFRGGRGVFLTVRIIDLNL